MKLDFPLIPSSELHAEMTEEIRTRLASIPPRLAMAVALRSCRRMAECFDPAESDRLLSFLDIVQVIVAHPGPPPISVVEFMRAAELGTGTPPVGTHDYHCHRAVEWLIASLKGLEQPPRTWAAATQSIHAAEFAFISRKPYADIDETRYAVLSDLKKAERLSHTMASDDGVQLDDFGPLWPGSKAAA